MATFGVEMPMPTGKVFSIRCLELYGNNMKIASNKVNIVHFPFPFKSSDPSKKVITYEDPAKKINTYQISSVV